MNIATFIIGTLLGALVSGFIIWVVGKLRLGLEVSGFGPAYLAAIVVGLLNAFANWFWSVIGYSPEGGWAGAVTHLVLTAGFFMAAGSWIKGLRVKGFLGALVAAVAVALVGWLIFWGISQLF